MPVYQSFVGLEIHVQLRTQTKVFCSCRANYGDEPNTNVCPVCMGYPGVLPALNAEAIEMAYTVARALNCDLATETRFDRKNYFYPDLPKNYQISQFHAPLGTNGHLDLEFRKHKKRVRIHQIHLEEDAGKMIHAGDMSLLDYNRTGTPLLEIVTEPDLEIGEEAETLLQELRRIVRYLGVCDGNMEEGSLRCDANVSVNLRGAGLGSKVEIKNMNSSRFVRKALNYEISRQQDILERGGTILQETRLWNENRDISEPMRTKESAHDYRYFPEPDLPTFRVDDAFLEAVESRLVELPASKRARFHHEYGLSTAQTELICDELPVAEYYERTVAAGADPQQTATWLSGDVRKMLNRFNVDLATGPLTAERLAELLTLLAAGSIHGKIAKQALQKVFEEDRSPAEIIEAYGWRQITDRAELEPIIREVLSANPKATGQVKDGDPKPVGYLVGQVMKATSGRADPGLVQELLKEQLSYQVIQVLSFGGAISGVRQDDGLVVPGDLMDIRKLMEKEPDLPDNLRFEEVQLGQFLSEEITPADWAALISTVQERISGGNAGGIVIGHGTDTLAYTASMLYWFFADTPVPIVLTASAVPGNDGGRTDAVDNLRTAIRLAGSDQAGIHVVYGEDDFLPVNLKFERAGFTAVPREEYSQVVGEAEDFYAGRFRTWNAEGLSRSGRALGAAARELPANDLRARLETAFRSTFVAKAFPGMQGESLVALMDAGVKYFVLEIYDTGTANLRETPFSLRTAFEAARERNVLFFCTSQQEGVVDFSEYVTAHQLWRQGAVPMGGLTTESVFTRLIAAQLVAETDEELLRIMEDTQ